MIIIPIIQTVVFALYTLYIVKKYGVLSSISESFYALPESKGYLFTLFIWGVSLPIMLLANISALFFLAGCLLMFVGAANSYRDEGGYASKIHGAGATGGIVMALLALVWVKIYWPIILATIASVWIKRSKIKNITWWVEIACFACIELGIIWLLIR